MAEPIISDFDTDLYQIEFKNLQKLHHRVSEVNAVLLLLLDWICECNISLESKDDRERLTPSLFLISKAVKEIQDLLPPL